jgi:hypothetical protein
MHWSFYVFLFLVAFLLYLISREYKR